ncbi:MULTISPECIES: DUF6188 family protein [Mycobacteriaceae]|nr:MULTISPECIES: DUF6188 family protein [Mycobacteriaceae]MCV7186980.1 hypothetical protein [Mycolicibacterium thermoresistibile]ORA63265.1 hypothetical protein BST23_18905 [Mycolicibacterium elephantis]ORW01128.1 hypothetical protein AWC14_10280 [Mycobacterium kyorinense]SNW20396.1 Uncharacterised protein [Mycolicibacterium thermoresistibile]GAT13155.1 putative uncharacterized protein [Mycolicibacterium thermoresistibile]
MLSQWIEGCAVQRVAVKDGLALDLDEYNELVIWGPLRLTVPPVGDCPLEEVVIDPNDVPVAMRPLLDFSGSTCTRALYDEDGHLHLEFSSGHRIDVAGDEHRTAWELYGKYHGYMACLPRGRVRVVRHDIPDEYDSTAAVAR